MFDEVLRPVKERVLYPVAKSLGSIFSPNMMTGLSLLLGLLSVLLIFQGSFLGAFFLWVLNRITDGLDGTIARITNKQSDLGGYLDIMADFLLYSLIPISFVLYRGMILAELVLLVMMLAVFYLNAASWMYLAGILEKRKAVSKDSLTSINMPLGLVEGFETIIIYSLFYLLPNNLELLFLIMSILTLVGVFQRIIWSVRNIT